MNVNPDIVLSANTLEKSFGALKANDQFSLQLRRGEIHGLIGPNGAGKTTAISLLAGEHMPDTGTIQFFGKDITRLSTSQRARLGIARSNQITSVLPDFTALENIALALWTHKGHGFRFFRAANRDALVMKEAHVCLQKVGLDDVCSTKVIELSHGQQRLLELAIVLAQKPKLLLLDEPMAGMGQEGAERISTILQPLKGRVTMLLVEHDMDAVFALADRITVLVEGAPIATGTPDEIRSNKQVQAAYLGDSRGGKHAEA